MDLVAMCPKNGECIGWVLKNLKYCVCNMKEVVSVSLGVVSVVTWTVAEIPQIITNYRQKSTEGLSFAFLSTWIIGDIFNVLGCWMEPATLPTQLYMAVLYTLVTLVLFGQAIYYDYLYQWLYQDPNNQFDDGKSGQNSDVDMEQGYYTEISDKNDPIAPTRPLNLPINVPSLKDLYYLSARSLTKSFTPPLGTFIGRKTEITTSNQSQPLLEESFLAAQASTEVPNSRVKPMLSAVSAVTFLGTLNLTSSLTGSPILGSEIRFGRKLLQDNGGFFQDLSISSLFGWGMMAIYIGGRIPQIFLTMKKGNVEGLNPLMFLFALIGNATYVGSILVNSLDWSELRPNLPWLLDAGGCVLLDAFILLQFIYLHHKERKARKSATLA